MASDQATSSSKAEQNIIAQIDNDHDQNLDNLFKAAAEGNIEPFIGKSPQELEQTEDKISGDTILHIHIKSQKQTIKPFVPLLCFFGIQSTLTTFTQKTKFLEQILDICPSLLLKANARDDTPLHVATRCGYSGIMQVLMQRAKAQPNDLESDLRAEWQMPRTTNKEGNTALHEAVIHRNLTGVLILTEEADPDFSYYANKSGGTPLYLAAALGSSFMVRKILESCKSASHEGPQLKTALHAAAKADNLAVTRLILSKRPSLTKEIDEYGWTPLHYASYYGCLSIAKLLLTHDISAIHIADNVRKMTPLLLAAGQGLIRIVREIIYHCPNCYEQVDIRGWNLLHFAVLSGDFFRTLNLLNMPLVRSLINEKDKRGYTPCHLCAYYYPVFLTLLKLSGGHLEALTNENVSVRDILNNDRPDELKTLEKEIGELEDEKGDGQYPYGVMGKTPYMTMLLKYWGSSGFDDKIRGTFLVVATLISTVTFTAAFTIPGGYNDEQGPNQGTAILTRNSIFQAFIVMDTIALILSLSAVFLYSITSLRLFIYTHNWDACAIILTFLAMGAMVVAFITGLYAVLAPSPQVTNAICVICLSFFLLVFYCLRQYLLKSK